MTLIRSISGIRGTIGGKPGEGLTPSDIVKFVTAYAELIRTRNNNRRPVIVVGRDARISGKMVSDLVVGTLLGCGANVLDIGLTTTPTTEMAVILSGATGGVIITASHNPRQWNALKLLNDQGEFLSAADGEELLLIAGKSDLKYAAINDLGGYRTDNSYLDRHIEKILELSLVDSAAIRRAHFSVVVDAVNSTGGIAVPRLLDALGVSTVHKIYCEPDGEFPHNPEPLPENLSELCETVVKKKADVGFAVDPDVDRLAIINEVGEPIGEEYTLVTIADYVLHYNLGNTVSNLSSSQALGDITHKFGGQYYASAVGEVNVVDMMKAKKAVIGGEGNGGVIYPDLHYGRDALVGIALFLTYLAKTGKKCSGLRDSYPDYHISKNKIEFAASQNIDEVLAQIKKRYRNNEIITIDGVRINFGKEWVHLRKSNTEPIIRIYAESDMPEKADNLARKIMNDVKEILNDQ